MSVLISLTEGQSLSSQCLEDEAARGSLQTPVQVVHRCSEVALYGRRFGPLQRVVYTFTGLQLEVGVGDSWE